MTEELKKLIKSIRTTELIRKNPISGELEKANFVLKSDFDRVVEELTKWNKVEDGLPEIQGYYFVRVEHSFPKNCHVIVSEFDDENNRFYSESGDNPIYDALEWKPIN